MSQNALDAPVRCPAQARTGQLLVPSDSARRRTGAIRRSNAMQYCVRACAGIYPGKYTYRDDLSAEQMALVAMENYDRDFRAKCAAGLPPIAALRCSCVSAARGRPRRVDRGMAVNTQRGTCNGGAQAPAACCSQLLGHRLCWSPARTCAVLCCAHQCMHACMLHLSCGRSLASCCASQPANRHRMPIEATRLISLKPPGATAMVASPSLPRCAAAVLPCCRASRPASRRIPTRPVHV
jgi:hypothetical protein